MDEKTEEKSGTEQPTTKNPALILAGKLKENQEGLRIARIPKKTKEAFIKFAEDEFCGDYGMALKWLMDDIISGDIRLVITKVTELDTRMSTIENTVNVLVKPLEKEEEQKPVVKRMLDGTMKRVK